FPNYFIADKAAVCTAQAVGCDGYTKLGAVTGGGEQQRYFTNIRACLTNAMADGNVGKTASTYFTWIGTDNTGYQLQTWKLLKSNVPDLKLEFAKPPVGSGTIENKPGDAPCTKFKLSNETTLECHDDGPEISGGTHLQKISSDALCDEHADLLTNPDCREFFDAAGELHYRRFSQTVSVDDTCEAYRKDKSAQSDCTNSGGLWTTQGFCRYFGLEKESKTCSAQENGCRLYTGGAGRNANVILDETFESGTYAKYQRWGALGPLLSATLSISNDSVATDGHSLNITSQSGISAGFATASSTLASSLKKGKIYTVKFWAKGTGKLNVGFAGKSGGGGKNYDFVDPTIQSVEVTDFKKIELKNSWNLYSLGPLDTSESRFTDFDQNSLLTFLIEPGKEFNIDNITLTQAE
ncbi:MAG: carbohydrate binding domain-containing protein, partial [Patescibacteria group bacterium]